jgi:adenine-specific DNA-methyltransferase
MPTLDWIGKKAVLNHHREVPYRLVKCDPKMSVGDPGSGNLLVQGDNLVALKALLPYYAGEVKCIYIDPPYNTGNEGWVYNDAVNSPEIRDWLHKQVKGEDEDLTRHDKWLCMMFPRLKLLSEFLKDDGVIIVSIDDFEAYRLRSIMDEVFGPRNFIAQLVWDKTRKNDAKLFSVGHEYLLVYAKSLPRLRELKTVWREQKPGATAIIAKWQELKTEYGDDFASIQLKLRDWYRSLPTGNPSKKLSRYKWVDKWGPWRDRDISWPGGGGPRYDVLHPETHLSCLVPEAGWRFAKPEEMQRQIDLGLVQFRDDHTEPPFRKAHLLPVPEELEADQTGPDDDDDSNQEEDANGELAGLQVMPSVIYKQAQVSVKLLRKIFDGRKVFPNPKDHEILMRLFRYISGPNDLILDAFAGSGSTAHAVLQLNKEESSNRRFVLVEMNEKIAAEITAERIKRVMRGQAGLPALGGSFRYCTVAEELFNCDGQVSDKVKFSALAQHVYFTETGEPLSTSVGRKRSPLIGVCKGTAYYLLFNGILGDKSTNGGNILTTALLRELPPHDGPKTIFGEGCRLGTDRLKRQRITFKQIPYEIKVS